VFVKNYFKISSLFSLFLVGVKPGTVILCVLYGACAGGGAAARLGVAAVCLRLFEGHSAKPDGAPAVVLVKPDDSIGAHIVSLF